MCGIAGLFSPRGASHPSHIQSMLDIIRYRGPDGEGAVLMTGPGLAPESFSGSDTPPTVEHADLPYAPGRPLAAAEPDGVRIALGHRRLAIVDLSPLGHQPMCLADRDAWVVYNGEIYNHVELRAELEKEGESFRSHSDTEVLLAAWKRWGRECLSRFNGMFGFMLADRRKRSIFVARDRFGVKPVYYWISPEGFLAVASEIKQFTVLPGWRGRVNAQRCYDFLNWSKLDHTDETMFQGVYQLPPGHFVELSVDAPLPDAGARLTTKAWYTLAPTPFSGDFVTASNRMRDMLADSVRLRLRSDVPVGSCLSGGLDSSSIVCLMSELIRQGGGTGRQLTFTAGSRTKKYDECDYARLVIDKTGVSPHFTFPDSANAFEELDELTWHQDEPFGSTSIFAQRKVFQLARANGVTVMLDGQGSDEQLAGYHTFFGPRLAELLKRARLATLVGEVRAMRKLHGYPPTAAAAALMSMLLPDALQDWARQRTGRITSTPEWLDLDLLRASPRDPSYLVGGKATSVDAMARAQILGSNLQMLLHWEDRNSMASSIEARVPFLDYRLVEFVLGLPADFKMQGAVTKRVLREAMRGILPEPVRTRMDKMGFVTAEEVWLRQEAPDQFRKAVREAVDASHGIIRPAAIQLVEDVIQGNRPFSFTPWRIISFGAWMRRFDMAV